MLIWIFLEVCIQVGPYLFQEEIQAFGDQFLLAPEMLVEGLLAHPQLGGVLAR